MYRKYFVYLDDRGRLSRIAVAAVSEEAAKAHCKGNGVIVAVRDVTDDYPIGIKGIREVLLDGGYGEPETDWICQLLTDCEIAHL